jgi:hypothetical protein
MKDLAFIKMILGYRVDSSDFYLSGKILQVLMNDKNSCCG